MELKSILVSVFVISVIAFIFMYGSFVWLTRRNQGAMVRRIYSIKEGRGHKADVHAYTHAVIQSFYTHGMKIPVISGYMARVRKRLSGIHAYDEYRLRLQTVKLTLLIWSIFAGAGIVLLFLRPGAEFAVLSLLCGLVINSLILDMSINQLEKRLLSQMIDFFADVRHRYHQHGMVEEAIAEATDLAGAELARHTRLIYEALTDADPNEALERYYESAPNRFLKAFAGVSFMVMEFGDQLDKDGSIYLKGLGSLTREIQLELLRRNKLDYLLKGLNIIALAPVFFTLPIERWARSSFPAMDEFYRSKLGFLTKISVYILIITAYFLLQKLQQTDETGYRAGKAKGICEKKLYRIPLIRQSVQLFMPRLQSVMYAHITRVLKDSGAEIKLEWFYVRRIILFIVCLLVSISTTFFLHATEKNHILLDPVQTGQMFGRMSVHEEKQAIRMSAIDRKIMYELRLKADATFNEVYSTIKRVESRTLPPEMLAESSRRIMDKLAAWNEEYLRWWELVLCLLTGYAGFQAPLLLLYVQRKMRRLDMRHEVYQFQTVIAILRAMERMSVEEMLEWLNRFAVVFKRPIQKCLLHYEHGPEEALNLLREEAPLPEFQRLVDKLYLSLGKITIHEAFDDLETQMAYHFEQRRQEYEKMIDTKAAWGRMIGFAPMYGLIFLYLVVPLIGMSVLQMDSYYEQIQKL